MAVCPSEDEFLAFMEGRLDGARGAVLQAHLDGCEACFALWSALGHSVSAPTPQPPPLPPLEEYQVLRLLGRGAMGEVFLARDLRLERSVAIKLLRPLGPAEVVRERFHNEARAIARLSHPNVVTLYRTGEHQGRPFLVSEYVAGASLAEVHRPLPWQRVLRIGIGLARGLSAAHRGGVLHRDLKPANALLTLEGEVKLLDFGLAKLSSATEPPPVLTMGLDDPLLTATGEVLGTPLYLAPELWRGEEAQASADVYSLGAVLYELLSGQPPHVALTIEALRAAALRGDPPPVCAHAPETPEALGAVVDRCLRRDAGLRYATGEELRMALELLEPQLLPAAPTLREPVGQRGERLRLAALTLGLALLGGGAWALRQRDAVQREQEELRRMELAVQAQALAQLPGHEDEALVQALEAAGGERDLRSPSGVQAAQSLGAAIAAGRRSRPLMHRGPVFSAAFSPDGARLLTVARRGEVELWDVPGLRRVAELAAPGSAEGEQGVAQFAPDGARAAVTFGDSGARIYDATSGVLLGELRGHRDQIHGMAFSPDSALLATASADGSVRLWGTAVGDAQGQLPSQGVAVLALAFASEDGEPQQLITGAADGSVRLFDVPTRAVRRLWYGHLQGVVSVAFDGGERVLSASRDGTARLWSIYSGAPLAQFGEAGAGALRGAQFSPDGRQVLTASREGALVLWDARSGQELRRLSCGSSLAAFAYAPGGSLLAAGGQDGVLHLWDASSGRALEPLRGHQGPLHGLVFSPDGRRLVSSSMDQSARLWDLGQAGFAPLPLMEPAPPRDLTELRRALGVSTVLVVAPDGHRAASGGGDGTVRLWDVNARRTTAIFRDHSSAVRGLSFSPEGLRLLVCFAEQGVRLYDLPERLTLASYPGPCEGARFSADGLVVHISERVLPAPPPAAQAPRVACDLLRSQPSYPKVHDLCDR